jgi:hypothetical protein
MAVASFAVKGAVNDAGGNSLSHASVHKDLLKSAVVYRVCCQFCCQRRLSVTFADQGFKASI